MADGVKLVSTLYNTGEVRVAEFTIGPNSVGSVHMHTHVNELVICLEGLMLVHQQDLASVSLAPGQRTTIPAGTVQLPLPEVKVSVVGVPEGGVIL